MCSVPMFCFRFEPSDCGKLGKFQRLLFLHSFKTDGGDGKFLQRALGLLDSISSNIKYQISDSQCSSLLIMEISFLITVACSYLEYLHHYSDL